MRKTSYTRVSENMNEVDYEEEKKRSPLRWVGKLFWWGFLLLVLAMMGWFTLCGIYQKGTKPVKRYAFTEEIGKQYEKNGAVNIRKLAEINSHTTEKLLFINNLYQTEQENGLYQFQLQLRFNVNSAVYKKLRDTVSDEMPFTFVLKDNEGNIYDSCLIFSDEALVYRYFKVVFADVDIRYAVGLKIYIYKNTGNAVDEADFFEVNTVWTSDGGWDAYTPSAAERKTISSPLPFTEGKTVFRER